MLSFGGRAPAVAIERLKRISGNGAKCPQGARKVNGTMAPVAAMAIKKACSVRKENALFL